MQDLINNKIFHFMTLTDFANLLLIEPIERLSDPFANPVYRSNKETAF